MNRIPLHPQAQYDPHCGTVERNGEPLKLRPKAQLVLNCLLENAPHLVARDHLLRAVWGHIHVSDHTLHQTISELRKTIGQPDCIGNIPNRGYCWRGPLPDAAAAEGDQPQTAPRHPLCWPAIAAMLALALLWSLPTLFGNSGRSNSQRLRTVTEAAETNPGQRLPIAAPAPAWRQLAYGMEAFEQGDYRQAAHHFQTSLEHHSEFAAARLELARSLWLLDQPDHALQSATQAISDARLAGDTYAEASAMHFLSRLQWLHGDWQLSLSNTQQSAQLALSHNHSCIALEARLWEYELLAQMLGNPVIEDPAPDAMWSRLKQQTEPLPQRPHACRERLHQLKPAVMVPAEDWPQPSFSPARVGPVG